MADDAMLRSILVAVDGSAYSGWAADAALALAADFGARITGIHVYAARLHERRFRDMEPGLPEEYREPAVLARQREVHGTLIEKGLRLISDSYLGALERRCLDAGIAFTGKTPDLLNNRMRGARNFRPANIRHNAIRAKIIAPGHYGYIG